MSEEREIRHEALKIPDMKYEELMNRIRIHEDIIRGIQKIIYKIDEDYQVAKHRDAIACMCCPFIRKKKSGKVKD